ncbi:sensor histidine kinase [Aurantimonas aggregata]|uniref:histidine kinase n=1 Tax=Aurantimonas aggregata TaxID=2047720 RepID=A0A6L9MIZ5_9HYPH|nr:ATP-binding protein [Aurantimonas aggregata]NDV87681.1 sensor histidine kinase [Aurantimonas aggregata]
MIGVVCLNKRAVFHANHLSVVWRAVTRTIIESVRFHRLIDADAGAGQEFAVRLQSSAASGGTPKPPGAEVTHRRLADADSWVRPGHARRRLRRRGRRPAAMVSPRRFAPRTIRGQMLVVIIVAIIAAMLLGHVVEEEFSSDSYLTFSDTERTVERALAVASMLEVSTPPERALIVARARQRDIDVTLVSASAAARMTAASPTLSRSERVAAYIFSPEYVLPSGGRRIALEGRPALSLPIDGNSVLLVRDLPYILYSDGFLGPVVYFALCFVTMFAFLSIFAMRRVASPLATISRELDRSDGVSEDMMLAESGTAELDSLVRALNGMRSRIREMIDNRTRMLRSVSHDLRTPLTRLRLRSERLEDLELRKGMMSDIDQINALVEETLDYLRADATGEKAERTDIASLLQTVQADFADVGFAVTYLGPDKLAADCKPKALVRAVTNLCENSLKFGTRAEISLTRVDETIRIDVADDGPGIPAHQRKLVLEPFSKLDASRESSKSPGFGLGLSIVSDVVRAHCGRIELDDNRPRGLIVRLHLPERLSD